MTTRALLPTALRALPAALAATCAFTATAQAARVDSTDGLLRYTAEPGELTNVDVRIDGDALRVEEFPTSATQPANPLRPSGECQPAEPNVVRCALGGGEVRMDMGVGYFQQLTIDDRLTGRIDGGQQLDIIAAGPPTDGLAHMRPSPVAERTASTIPARIAAARSLTARATRLASRVLVAGRPGAGFTIDGNGGGDFVVGGRGDDTIELGPLGGVIFPGYGADRVDGGPDGSYVDYSDHTGDITVDLRDTRAVQGERGERDRLINTPWVIGGQARNDLTGNDRDNFLVGYGGTGGRIVGNGGHDYLGANVNGPAGTRMLGGPGEDTFIAQQGGPDVLDGGPGGDIDAAVFQTGRGFKIDLPNGRAVGSDGVVDRLDGIEWVEGSVGDDELIGDERNNLLDGGFDLPDAAPGNDRIIGGAGSDDLIGQGGDDVLDAVDGEFDFVSCGEPEDPAQKDHDRARVDADDGVEPGCEELSATPGR